MNLKEVLCFSFLTEYIFLTGIHICLFLNVYIGSVHLYTTFWVITTPFFLSDLYITFLSDPYIAFLSGVYTISWAYCCNNWVTTKELSKSTTLRHGARLSGSLQFGECDESTMEIIISPMTNVLSLFFFYQESKHICMLPS